jgi:hypothetical protein
VVCGEVGICGVLRLVIMVGLEWVVEWVVEVWVYFESGLQHSPTQQMSRTQPVKSVDDDCSYPEPRNLYGCHCDDIVCLTIRYHETDGSSLLTDSKTSLKTLHQDTDKSLHLLREFRYRNNRLWTGDCHHS